MKFDLQVNSKAEESVSATLHRHCEFADRLEEMVMEYNGCETVTVYTEDDIAVLKFSDIECITVIDSKTFAIDKNGESYRLKKRLYEIEEILPSSFIKINKSSIANRNSIKKFSAAFSGSVDVIFKSGYTDYVSRRCFAQIKKELK
ncbi:MAG: LytTR family transcriptional regulator [Ruminococcus sp.]|nr:LytTR family transcriptional regulator [Ruminococcus sp.]